MAKTVEIDPLRTSDSIGKRARVVKLRLYPLTDLRCFDTLPCAPGWWHCCNLINQNDDVYRPNSEAPEPPRHAGHMRSGASGCTISQLFVSADMTNELVIRRVLWGVGTARTMRPHWALHELLLPYETEAIGPRTGETQTAKFTALNPRQKIPVLQDGDFTIAESPAIVAYLAETYSGGNVGLLPSGQRKRAQCLEWSFFITMELDATSLYVVRRHGPLKHIYGEAPVAVENAKNYFFSQLGHVDQVLRADGPFLMGNEFTIADILLTTCLTWAIREGAPVYDSCRAYLERVMTREAYKTASAANARRQSTT